MNIDMAALHAIEADLPIPIGPQNAELLDSRFTDDDESGLWEDDEEENGATDEEGG